MSSVMRQKADMTIRSLKEAAGIRTAKHIFDSVDCGWYAYVVEHPRGKVFVSINPTRPRILVDGSSWEWEFAVSMLRDFGKLEEELSLSKIVFLVMRDDNPTEPDLHAVIVEAHANEDAAYAAAERLSRPDGEIYTDGKSTVMNAYQSAMGWIQMREDFSVSVFYVKPLKVIA